MSFIDMEITRRQFAARYVNVGRAMLGTLADMYGIDSDIAEHWADAIDRETDQQIAVPAPAYSADGGIEGAALATIAVPSTLSHSAVPTRSGGAGLPGVACTADVSGAPGFPPFPSPSRRVATRIGRGGEPCAAPTEPTSRS